jgi:uncharacterized protein (DUF608 family)
MPLGGIGTGHFCLFGDGSFRQWQIFNVIHHLAFLPGTFFALSVKNPRGEPKASLLLSRRFLLKPPERIAPSVSDHYVPEELKKMAPYALLGLEEPASGEGSPPHNLRGEVRFTTAYPVAWLDFLLPDERMTCSLTAWTPFLIFDSDLSGMPLAVFDWQFRNEGEEPLTMCFLASWQNAVGWDGVSSIRDVLSLHYGGNVNQTVSLKDRTEVRMTHARLPEKHPAWGNMTLTLLSEDSFGFSWQNFSPLWQALLNFDFGDFPRTTPPSEPSRTHNGGVGFTTHLSPHEEKNVTVLFSWYFPNRYVNFEQHPKARTSEAPAYLGNYYAKRFESSWHVGEFALTKLPFLRDQTIRVAEVLASCPCPEVGSAVSSNLATLRTAVCFRTEDGHFFSFEGGCGASTGGMEAFGGCCPLNCTHVWNYDQTLFPFFPDLHRDMRDTDWLHNQHPSGYLPHRTLLPLSVPPLWGEVIGGPDKPAVDGLLSAILKTYQYWQTFEDDGWFQSVLPCLSRAFDYLWQEHDPTGEGILRGEQPCTYDISLYGPNTFMGSLYLSALKAGEKMFREIDSPRARECGKRFASGSRLYDRLCFNGEYFIQDVPHDEYEYQYGKGCMADQLLGQWWAHILRLGYVLPRAHVRRALRSILAKNFHPRLEGISQSPRVFAMPHESGLLNVVYPEGARPRVPLSYSDEVWSGVEYAVSALLIFEGMMEEGLSLVRAVQERYSGHYRNPFNEVECGDHYIRPLSAFSVWLALSGAHYQRLRGGTLAFYPKIIWESRETRYFFTAGRSYGELVVESTRDGIRGRVSLEAGICAFRNFEMELPPTLRRPRQRDLLTIRHARGETRGKRSPKGFWRAQGDFLIAPGDDLWFEIRG